MCIIENMGQRKGREAKFKSIEYQELTGDLSYDVWPQRRTSIRELVLLARAGGNRIIVFNRNDVPIAYINPSGRIHQLCISSLATKASEI